MTKRGKVFLIVVPLLIAAAFGLYVYDLATSDPLADWSKARDVEANACRNATWVLKHTPGYDKPPSQLSARQIARLMGAAAERERACK